jgi:hypothetical protein
LIVAASGGGEEAVHYFEEACAIYREMGDEFSAAAIEGWHLAGHAVWRGDVEMAYRLTDHAIPIMKAYHHDIYRGRALVMQALRASLANRSRASVRKVRLRYSLSLAMSFALNMICVPYFLSLSLLPLL